MEQTDQRAALAKLPFLSGLPEATLAHICEVIEAVAEPASVPEGKELLQEGYLGFATGYILLDGTVRIDREGKEPVDLSGPELLGEMSQFLQDDTRSATVRALTDTNLLKFSWDDLYDRAKELLSEEENKGLSRAIEQVVWKRYGLADVMKLAMLKDIEDDVKIRVCLPFPWISKPMKLANNEALFEVGTRCKSQGFLLTSGTISIIWPGGEQKEVSAPNIIGVMPNHKPDRLWSASARASGDAKLLAFSWIEYDKKLRQRLSNSELTQFFESLKKNGKRHFWH